MAIFWGRGGESKESERIATLEKAVEAQVIATEHLESKLRLIAIEWESVLDKVNSVMGRLNARIRKFKGTTDPESDEQEPVQGPAPPPVQGSHGALTAMRGRRRGVLSG